MSKNIKFWIKGWLIFTSSLILIILLLYWFIPWKPYIEKTLIQLLQSQNVPITSFMIQKIGTHQTILKDVTLSTTPPITLPQVTLTYSATTLYKEHRINQFILDKPIYEIQLPKEEKPAPTAQGSTPLLADLLKYQEQLISLPLDEFILNEGTIIYRDKNIELSLPFNIQLNLQKSLQMKLTTDETILKINDKSYELLPFNLDVTQSKDSLSLVGKLTGSAKPKSKESPLPHLGTQIDFSADLQRITGTLSLFNKDTENLLLKTNYHYHVDKNQHQLNDTIAYWQEGKILLTPLIISSKKPNIKFKADFKNIALQPILNLISDKHIQADGVIEGTLPITLAGTNLQIGKGKLETTHPGHLEITADYLNHLAQNNAQIKNVSLALSNFDYEKLIVHFNQLDKQTTIINLEIKGKSPQAYNDRFIHLNINIGGNLYSLIMSNLQLYDLPHILTKKMYRYEP